MYRFDARWLVPVALVPAMATSVHAQTLFESDEIELRGTARIVGYATGTCVVSEDRETAAAYEEKKAHHDQPVDIWQLDFSVYNASGRPFDDLIAVYRVEAGLLPCTDLSLSASADQPGRVARGIANGQLQRRVGETAPGESVVGTSYIWVLRDDEPRFVSWMIDYSLASAPGEDVRRDAPQGTRIVRFPNGTVDWGPYVDDRRHGRWAIRFSNGLVEEGPYVAGNRHGHWVIRFPNGVVEEGPFVDAKRHGRWIVRFPIGTVEEGPFVDGRRHGRWIVRFLIGTVEEGPFVDGKRHGHWIIRFPDETVEEGPYVDGVRHGHWVVRFADGVLEEGLYEDNNRQGRWTIRFPNGAVEDVFYVDGRKVFE